MGDDGFRRVVLMRRGEVRLVDLDPVRGSEANKQRPAVVVSNDRANAVAQRLERGVVTVVPLTSNTARISRSRYWYPPMVLVCALHPRLKPNRSAPSRSSDWDRPSGSCRRRS